MMDPLQTHHTIKEAAARAREERKGKEGREPVPRHNGYAAVAAPIPSRYRRYQRSLTDTCTVYRAPATALLLLSLTGE